MQPLSHTHTHTRTHTRQTLEIQKLHLFSLRVACTLVQILLRTQTTCIKTCTDTLGSHSLLVACLILHRAASKVRWNAKFDVLTFGLFAALPERGTQIRTDIYLFIWGSGGCSDNELDSSKTPPPAPPGCELHHSFIASTCAIWENLPSPFSVCDVPS